MAQSPLSVTDDLTEEVEISIPPPAPDAEHLPAIDGSAVNKDGYKVLNSINVFVLNGVHEGATFSIKDTIKLGSSFENDLILTDESIADYHVTLEPIEGKLDFGLKVTCKADNLTINAQEHLVKDEELIIYRNFVLTLGDISLNITVNSAGLWTTAYQKYLSPQLEIAETYQDKITTTLSFDNIISDSRNILLIILSFILLLFGSIFLFRSDSSQISTVKSSETKFIDISVRKDLENKRLTSQALKDLKDMIVHYDLSGRVNAYKDQKTIYISGQINSFENKNWTKVNHWYDMTYSAKVNLVSLLEVNNGLRRKISFKAVVTKGRMPYVVSWTGDRYKPGATLPGGWIIEKIDNRGVHVRDAIENRLFIVEHIRGGKQKF